MITAAMVVTPVMRSLISGRVALLLLLGCHRHCDEPAAGRTGVDANCTTTDDDGSVDAEIFAPRTPAEVMKCGKGPDHQESARSLKVIDHDLALAEKHGFRPIDESTQLLVDENAIPNSRHWLPRFLLPEASPYRPALEVRRSVVDFPNGGAPDMLRHEYSLSVTDDDGSAHRLHVTVTETYYELRIAVEHEGVNLLALPVDERAGEISWIAAHVIALHGTHHNKPISPETFGMITHDWVFFYDALNEGSRFSTGPRENLLNVWSWAYRVDGGIAKGRVYFLGHKISEGNSSSGPHQSLWFEGGQSHDASAKMPETPVREPRP